jgi:geranylgeranylglycerol-phosphate geranylgeranyltransferase
MQRLTAREQTAPQRVARPGETPSRGRRLADLVILVRLPSCLAGGASVLLGMHLAAGKGGLSLQIAWPGVLSMFFAVAAANAVNDVLDIDTDTVGKPNRPLPTGRLTARSALVVSGTAALAAVAFASALGGYAILWTIVLLALAFVYSYRAKNTVLLGNAVVALCASSPILLGAIIAGRPDSVAWIGTGLSFTFMLGYETLKTIADRDSDAASGVHTFASQFGVRAAVLLFRALTTLLTLAACAASTASPDPVTYLLAVVVTFVLPAWSAIVVLGKLPDENAIRRSIFLMRSAWFLGIIALWLLR